jgi:hypothetical protein
MLSSSSIYSRDSFAADSRALEAPMLEAERNWVDGYTASQQATQGTALLSSFQPTRHTLQNQESPYPTCAAFTQKPFCFACNEHFKNKGSLSRHQKEQCEREKVATCSLCPPPQLMYYSERRLFQHHVASHGDKCKNGCSKKELSGPCKEHLSESFEELPPKKAWGCPYCVRCFKSFDERNCHCIGHFNKAGKAPQWSFGIMITSLLQQDNLTDARMCHDPPEPSTWSTINEKTCSGLREILEYCTIPTQMHDNEYWYLDEANAVVRCVYDLMAKGHTPPNLQLFEARIKPFPYQRLPDSSAGRKDVGGSFPAHGDANKAIKTYLRCHDRTGNPPVTQNVLRKRAGSASVPRSTAAIDTSVILKARPAEISAVGDPAPTTTTTTTTTRKRGPSLKRSLSGLALRPSTSRRALPPLPVSSEKVGTAAPHELGWPTAPYLDPIPHHRPMSGVEYPDWHESDQGQNH